ncbi:translation initiation factor IF-2 [Anaeroselena agilis]|uniref:Translation initiation factor IF-2 n=1 Tax=Anaeroselena agilis TaxID=3063788 RepID=A0ABU3NWY7_9FIRM|nr:translation initiation factor IF-2 [Selenomonadales bacterium 4137-cl]
MSKYRVYELAKDYNTTSKVIIDILARNNITVKNHMASLDDPEKAIIDRTFARKTGLPEEPKPAQAPSRPPLPPAGAPVRPQQPPRPAGQAPSAPQGQRPPMGGPQQGQRPPMGPRPGQGPQQQGQRPPMGGPQQGGRPPMGPRPGQGPQQQGQRPPMGGPQQGGRPPMGPRPGQGPQQQGQRPPMGGPQQGGRPPMGPRPGQGPQQGGRPPMGPRPGQGPQQGGRPPMGPRPGQGPQQGGRPPMGPRPGQGPQQGGRPSGGPPGRGSGGPPRGRDQGKSFADRNNGGRRGHSGRHASGGPSRPQAPKPEPQRPKNIKVGPSLTVKDLAAKMGREVSEVIKKLMMLGIMATINQEVDFDTAVVLGSEFGVTVEELPPEADPTEIAAIEDDPASLQPRPPVVTIMGHVDHGKTSLLDSIRQTNVTAQEAGGITQHIGAYQVVHQGKRIVFLDTPGHEAFTAMRARGANVTDIAILVVAADDGVMPQTIEALNHAKAAKVPIIVAVNKMDRPGANPDRVKQQLADHGLLPEDWGGDTIMVPVSAFTKQGIPDLLEMILLVAEMGDLKANPNRQALGTIIEAQLDKGRGPVATVLVQKGTLHIGDTIIAGVAYGKVRAMVNDRGDKVKKALPSTPVEVLGLSDVPQAGDVLYAVDERTARAVAEKRVAKKRTEDQAQGQKVSLDDLFKHIQEGSLKDLNIVVKADVQGSIEALRQSLENLKNKEVRVNIVHAGVGAVNESDVMLASTANALIIGFNVRPDNNARQAAEKEKIDIRLYRVIYEAINDVEAAMTGMLAPEYKEVVLGRVEVRQVISIPKAVVAGSYVLEGKITSSSQVRIIRNGIVVHEGKIESLRRFKDDVKEVASGYECGITIERFRDIKEGDIIEAFTMELVKPS